MRFRKKSIVVDVEQFDPDGQRPDGVFEHKGRWGIYTMSGFRHVNTGDWIITNPDGDKSVFGTEEFDKLYESAEE